MQWSFFSFHFTLRNLSTEWPFQQHMAEKQVFICVDQGYLVNL